MTAYGTREAQLDGLLRRETFVDLYKVVRESIRTSEPGLSIKDLEVFYMEARQGDVQTAGDSIVRYNQWRLTNDSTELERICQYNEVDCESTHRLRDLLLRLRPEGLPWFTPSESDAKGETLRSERVAQIEAALARYKGALIDCLPADQSSWNVDERVRELVFHLLDFHRRCEKPEYWAMFARRDLAVDELIDDSECIGGLERTDTPSIPDKRSFIREFAFPEQETKLRTGKSCTRCDTAKDVGTIHSMDEERRVLTLRSGADRDVPDQMSLGPSGPVNSKALQTAIARFADALVAGDGRFGAGLAFLRRDPPKFHGRPAGNSIIAGKADLASESLAAALALDRSYLFIQGPPGAGKTTIGSKLIVALLRAGKRVGVTSNSHKAINNLLAAVERQAKIAGFSFAGVKKIGKDEQEQRYDGDYIRNVRTADAIVGAPPALVAGTAWLFSEPGLEQCIDYLFVDEAGQVSVANLVAMSTAARNLLLLGDQMQLGQPIQGLHPGDSGKSTLDYLLDGKATVADDRGIFLPVSYRMHEDVCRFISDAVYDGRLEAHASTQRRCLGIGNIAHAALRPTGIRFWPVEHQGRRQSSPEEVTVVGAILDSLLGQQHTDQEGTTRPIVLDDVLVVAPYNAQVNLLKAKLPAGTRVGTIDKFQGQEAPVVLVFDDHV